MKYISMKMEPKGSRPPTREMTHGRRYHRLSGMGEGMRLTLHGGRQWRGRGKWKRRERESEREGAYGAVFFSCFCASSLLSLFVEPPCLLTLSSDRCEE